MKQCIFCKKELKEKNYIHQKRCSLNPDKIILKKSKKWLLAMKKRRGKGQNQYTKAVRLGLNKPVISDETRKKLSEASSKRVWTEAQKKKHSKIMRKTVLKYPDSYSASNISGRVKTINYKGFKLKGSWELITALFLNKRKIKWTNKIKPFNYFWKNKNHLYFPDFYLPKYKLYIEVKGYETKRDRAKWKNFPKKLLILKNNEIKLIKQNKFNLI